jgi:hypothetical protein
LSAASFGILAGKVCFQGHFYTGLDFLVLLHQGKSTEPFTSPLNKDARATRIYLSTKITPREMPGFVLLSSKQKGPKILGLSSNCLGELPAY